ncbi:hypothetical protein H8356DRAFT_1681655 [Neocallimastix lanati (nom. inval.)]|nr:hypothetical protein H8356DRAFT_1681655 [Neocallimastix sp. JGI-2020a]
MILFVHITINIKGLKYYIILILFIFKKIQLYAKEILFLLSFNITILLMIIFM